MAGVTHECIYRSPDASVVSHVVRGLRNLFPIGGVCFDRDQESPYLEVFCSIHCAGKARAMALELAKQPIAAPVGKVEAGIDTLIDRINEGMAMDALGEMLDEEEEGEAMVGDRWE